MSENYYPRPPMPADPGAVSPPRRIGPELGLACVAVGLGIFLSVLITVLVYTALGRRPSGGMTVLALVGLLIAAGIGATAFTAYRRSTPIAWWQVLGVALGLGLFLNSIVRALDGGPLSVIAGSANLISLVLMVGGGIFAAVQAARQPAAPPYSPLTAPLVGYTADGQPVYGSHLQSRSTNTFAVLALVFGILGGLLGVVFGHVALSQIKRTGEGGHGLAIAGLVLGYMYAAVLLLMILGYTIFSLS